MRRIIWERRRAIIVGLAAIILFIVYMNSVSLAEPKIAPPGGRAVGALIIPHPGRPPHPFCTASVITSHKGDLLLTAAHCLSRKKLGNVMFAPGFYRGHAKFGEWKVTNQFFAPGWFGGNVNRDFAFLTVQGDVQASVGAEKLGYTIPVPRTVRVEGYSPLAGPVVCNRKPGTIKVSGLRQLVFDCPGYSNASSGAPFLTDINSKSGQGTVVGVIGGYQQGGDYPWVSYSSPVGPALYGLYRTLGQPSLPPAARRR
jgi:hypothetical protein